MARKVVENLDTLGDAFRSVSAKARTNIAKALRLGGQDVAAAARTFVPRDTGALAQSIGFGVSPLPDDKGAVAVVHAGAGLPIPDQARWVEFGTAPGERGTATPAQPFMHPAYRLNRKRVVGRIKRAVKAAAKEAANT